MAGTTPGTQGDHRAALAITVGAVPTLVGVFGPWLRSGVRRRSSFDVLDLVDRLGFAPDGPYAALLRAWPLVPLLVVGAVVATWAGRTLLGASLALGVGLYVSAMAFGVLQAPDSGLVGVEWGVSVALAGGMTLIGAAGLAFTLARRRASP